jgi:hypothetical protein
MVALDLTKLVQILMRADESFLRGISSQLSSILTQLWFSIDRSKKALTQTFASQLDQHSIPFFAKGQFAFTIPNMFFNFFRILVKRTLVT